MKTKTIALLAILTFIGINLHAQDSHLSHSAEKNMNGKPITIVSTNIKTSKPVIKNTFTYDINGNRKTKVLYVWDSKMNNWAEKSMTEYHYDNYNRLSLTSFVKWDAGADKWSRKSKNMVYTYDQTGKFLSIQHIKSERTGNTYLTQR